MVLTSKMFVIDDKREKKDERYQDATLAAQFCFVRLAMNHPKVQVRMVRKWEGDLGVIDRKVLVVVGRNTLGVTDTEGEGQGQNSVSLKVLGK